MTPPCGHRGAAKPRGAGSQAGGEEWICPEEVAGQTLALSDSGLESGRPRQAAATQQVTPLFFASWDLDRNAGGLGGG